MRVLIVKLSSLGDVVQTMPVVHDILAAFPRAQIDWVVEEAFAPLVQEVSGVRRVLPIAQRRWRKSWFSAPTKAERAAFTQLLQAQDYDAVIDFQGLIKSALVARSAQLASADIGRDRAAHGDVQRRGRRGLRSEPYGCGLGCATCANFQPGACLARRTGGMRPPGGSGRKRCA